MSQRYTRQFQLYKNRNIVLHIFFNNGYVWSPKDVWKLRSKYHMRGLYIGGILELRIQNEIIGLPLLLSLEEMYMLVCKVGYQLYSLFVEKKMRFYFFFPLY